MAQLLDSGIFSAVTLTGGIGVGWKLNFYISGTSTRLDTYPTEADATAATNPNANPLVVPADGRVPACWLKDQDYKLILTDENGVVKNTVPVLPRTTSDRLYFLQAGTGAVSRSIQSKMRDTFSAKDFGATGDGTTDDTAAIQLAINAAGVAGGTVLFPRGRYLVTSTLTVSSTFPVHLVADMAGQFYSATSVAWPSILIGAAMTYVVQYSAPDQSSAATRALHGAGTIKGLAFLDPTGTAGTPGSRTVTAALYLKDFCGGLVEGCYFHYIKGSAILTDFAVMTTIKGCRVRYCGDTANLTRSAVLLAGTATTTPTQSFTIEDTRIEVCYSTYYLSADGVYTLDVSLRGVKFEAADTEYPLSGKGLLYLNIIRYLVDGCFFNRTSVDAVLIGSGGRGAITGCTWTNGVQANTSLKILGAHNLVNNCTFTDNSTGLSIWVEGTNNIVTGCSFYRSGGFYAPTGVGNIFANNKISGPTRSAGYFVTVAASVLVAHNSFTNNGETLLVGGIIAQLADKVYGNDFISWPGQTCIRRADAASVIYGNTFGAGGVGTAYSEATPATTGFSLNGTKVLGPQITGWTAATGTPARGAFAAAAAGTASAGYVQAEANAALTRIAALEARLIAYDADLRTHGIIGT